GRWSARVHRRSFVRGHVSWSAPKARRWALARAWERKWPRSGLGPRMRTSHEQKEQDDKECRLQRRHKTSSACEMGPRLNDTSFLPRLMRESAIRGNRWHQGLEDIAAEMS